jgi:hypothetical protein
MTYDNKSLLYRSFGEVDSAIYNYGLEGYKLISVVQYNDLWYVFLTKENNQ